MLETRDLLRQILNVVVENRLGARPEDDDTNGEAQPVTQRFAEADREIYGAKLDTGRTKSTAAQVGMLWGRPLIIGETWPSVMGDVTIATTGTYYDDVPWYGFKPAADPHVHEIIRLTADRLEHFLLPEEMATENRTFADVVRERDEARGLADEMAKVADKAMADAKEKRAQIEGISGVVSDLNRRIDLQKDALADLRTRHATLCEDHTKLEADRDSWKQEAHLQRDRANKAASTDPDAAEQIEALKEALEEVKRKPTNVPNTVRTLARLASQCVNITNEYSEERVGLRDAAKRLFCDYLTAGQVDALARLHHELPEA